MHRAHLYEDLVKITQRHGANLLINSKVNKVDSGNGGRVIVSTDAGRQHLFDLLIGSDDMNSVIRKSLFPGVKPAPPMTNCPYRAIVLYEQIRKGSAARDLVDKLTMDVWMAVWMADKS